MRISYPLLLALNINISLIAKINYRHKIFHSGCGTLYILDKK